MVVVRRVSNRATGLSNVRAIIEGMTERGLPIVDGAPACPFVAFEDDRDARATSPDHRHRCYAEVRPAPRALAHQEAYCLSSAFPVCPTFQDWARREAAQARVNAASAASAAAAAGGAEDGGADAGSERNPPRAWSAPPPWSPGRGPGGGGLSGSVADRLAAGEPIAEAEEAEDFAAGAGAAAMAAEIAAAPPARSREEAYPPAGRAAEERRAQPPMARPAGPPPSRRPPMPIDPDAPSWERPRRLEEYPSLRARVGLPSIKAPPILIGVLALILASLAVFMLPGFLGLGGPGPDASTTPGPSAAASVGPSASTEPTPTPAPTQQVYIVESGDTLSGIATRFGITLEALRAANPQITDVDQINIGDEIIIPASVPTQIPDAGSPSPEASAAP